jgi:stage V sporulation protein S
MTLRVSGQSAPGKVAGALAARLKEDKVAHMEAVGANAVNQAVKALAIARGYVAPGDLVATPSFGETDIGGQEKTSIHFTVEMRSMG